MITKSKGEKLKTSLAFLQPVLMVYSLGSVDIPGKKNLLYFIKKAFLTYLTTVHVVFTFIEMVQPDLTLNERVSVINLTFEYIVTTVMVLSWYRNKKALIEAMEEVDNNVPEIGDENQELLKIINEENLFRKRCCYSLLVIFICTGGCAVLVWLLKSLFSNNVFEEYIDSNNNTVRVYTEKLPYPVYIPFEYRSSLLTYVIVGLIFTCPTLNYILMIVGADGAFISFTCFACGHFKILQYILKTITARCNKNGLNFEEFARQGISSIGEELNNTMPDKIDHDMQQEIKACAIYLNTILKFCSLLEEVYSKILLLQTTFSTAITACCLVVIMQTMGDAMFAHSILFLSSYLTIIFCFCYFGNRLATTSMDINYSIYENDWIGASKPFKSSIMIILIRMTRSAYLSIGGISPVTLNTFLQIVKGGYSMLAVIRTIR